MPMSKNQNTVSDTVNICKVSWRKLESILIGDLILALQQPSQGANLCLFYNEVMQSDNFAKDYTGSQQWK